MGLTGNISSALIIGIIVIALIAPWITPYDPNAIDLHGIKEPPSIKHLMGTDNKGRDILTRVLYGGRISLSVAFLSLFLSMTIGLTIGMISGYFGGRLDTVCMAFVDLILAFPSLLLAVGVSLLFPSGVYTVMIAIASVGWTSFARLVRGHVLLLREATFIEAAHALGCGNARIIFMHLLPQCIPLVIVVSGLKLGGFVLTEAALSFLGLGAQPPTATWGSMISINRAFINSAPWMIVPPGVMIALTALSFNILGDELRDKFDLRKNRSIDFN